MSMQRKIRYSVMTWQQTYGERRWLFIIKKSQRVTFKRSKREGWRGLGFVAQGTQAVSYATRPEALAAGKAVKAQLEAR